MRAGARLRVVLHAEGRVLVVDQTREGAVVETHVALGHVRYRAGLDREVVVLGGDLDLRCAGVLHGHVAAVVAELHLVGPAPERSDST